MTQSQMDVRISSTVKLVSVEKTRPADTTAYTANDIISQSASAGTVWTFTNVVNANGKAGYIVLVKALMNEKDTPRLRLHLFNAAPTGAVNDNVANTNPKYADGDGADHQWLGTIDLPALGDGSSDGLTGGSDTVQAEDDTLRKLFQCASGSRSLIVVVETLDAWTPASGTKLTITLGVEQAN